MARRQATCSLRTGLCTRLIADRRGEIALLEHLIPETRFVGEIGVDDGTSNRASPPAQRGIFGRIAREAECLGGRVLIIHSGHAAREVVECLTANGSAERVLPILY
jgi:TatD DNase family protein